MVAQTGSFSGLIAKECGKHSRCYHGASSILLLYEEHPHPLQAGLHDPDDLQCQKVHQEHQVEEFPLP